LKAVVIQSAGHARQWLPFLFGIALCALLWHEFRALDWAAVHAGFVDIPAWRWALAALATALSFMAIAQYDLVAHRHFRTEYPAGVARCAGAAAIAVGQTTGFGPATGAALRWRVMPDLGHAALLGITGLVTVSFMTAWALLVATLALPTLAGWPGLALISLPLGLGLLGLLLLFRPEIRFFGQRVALPSLRAMLQMVVLAACDMVFAGLTLYLLLPPEVAPPMALLVAAYALALGAGMIGGTPGGAGPFELTLLALLPMIPAHDLAAALIGFRLVFYALPCGLGALYAGLAGPHTRPRCLPKTHGLIGTRAELAIATQTDHRQITAPDAAGVALRTAQTLALFLGPTRGSVVALLPDLRRAARQENRLPCLYKITARDAAQVRRAGWCVQAFAVEAVIDPRSHDLTGPGHRQLRRFLRKAETAGITVRRIETPDWAALAEIHKAWEARHGRERGFSMGRYCPLYLADKPLFGAYHRGELIAFTSWLESSGAISLDLMRHRPETPQGTMHALIHTAINDARASGLTEVNLAALSHPALPRWLIHDAGLDRFKSSFVPRWRPLYLAAPSLPALTLAAADIRRAILYPAPLPRPTEAQWHLDAQADTAPLLPDRQGGGPRAFVQPEPPRRLQGIRRTG
jgi:phosphatidylglycerol lysyltransferase